MEIISTINVSTKLLKFNGGFGRNNLMVKIKVILFSIKIPSIKINLLTGHEKNP